MKKRIVALLLTLLLVLSAAMASAATYYRVNTSHLKVHMFDSEKSQVVASRERDFALTITKKAGDWVYVKFTNGDEGYVLKKYLAKNSSYSAWVTNDDTPIRKGPGYTYSDVGTLAQGAKVTVLTHGSKYDYVKSSVGYGYVLNARLSKKKVKASGSKSEAAFTPASNYTAWISNGTRTVNLRSDASKSAPVIQAYPTGTEVLVLTHGEEWDYVQIGSVVGYMMSYFLTTSAPAPVFFNDTATTEIYTPYTAYVTSDNGKGVNIRRGPGIGETFLYKAPYGAEVTVLEHGSQWDKVTYGSVTGYMRNSYLTLNKPADASATLPDPPSPAPTVTYPYSATTVCPEGEKVNLRSKPWKDAPHLARLDPGTTVTVTGPVKINGKTYSKWVAVEYNGIKGFMMKEFLK